MFNVSRDNNWLGFSVGLPEEPPGFRIGEDGSPLPVLASRPTSPPLPSPPGTGIPPDMGELMLQTGGPIGPETMMGLQDRFADNPYWPAERGQRRVSPIMPGGTCEGVVTKDQLMAYFKALEAAGASHYRKMLDASRAECHLSADEVPSSRPMPSR